MSKKKRNQSRQGFLNHVDTIKHLEKDKDRFLEAARLSRHEAKSRWEPEDVAMIVIPIAILLFIFGVLALAILAG